jgi:hemoglobin
VVALVERFYDAMSEIEPALALLHPCDEAGRVTRESRDRARLGDLTQFLRNRSG